MATHEDDDAGLAAHRKDDAKVGKLLYAEEEKTLYCCNGVTEWKILQCGAQQSQVVLLLSKLLFGDYSSLPDSVCGFHQREAPPLAIPVYLFLMGIVFAILAGISSDGAQIAFAILCTIFILIMPVCYDYRQGSRRHLVCLSKDVHVPIQHGPA